MQLHTPSFGRLHFLTGGERSKRRNHLSRVGKRDSAVHFGRPTKSILGPPVLGIGFTDKGEMKEQEDQ